MFRVHYRAPKSLPSHQRDFPPGGHQEKFLAQRVRTNLLSWLRYVVALIAGTVLLGQLAASNIPNTTSAEVVVGR